MGSLSVVIAAYNAESLIGRAVESALRSGAAEVIVVDDGSEDQTGSHAEAAGAVVITQANAGAALARRTGLAQANGEYVIFLDADDVLVAEGVAMSQSLLDGDLDAGAAFGRTMGIRADGSEVPFAARRKRLFVLELLHLGYSPTPPAAVVWRKTASVAAMHGDMPGLWPRYAEDYELLVRGSLTSPVLSHDTFACRYALEGGKSDLNALRSVECAIAIQRHYSRLLGFRAIPRSARSVRTQVELRGLRVNARTRGQVGRILVSGLLRSPLYMLRLQVGRRLRARS